MYEFIKQSLSSWSHQKDQRRKLQQAYLTVVFIGLVLAGLLTLLNVPQSRLAAMIAAGFAAKTSGKCLATAGADCRAEACRGRF